MNEKDILFLLEKAFDNNDVSYMRNIYQNGLKALAETHKLNDYFAFLMMQKGYYNEAYEASKKAVIDNRSRLNTRKDAKALYDYALANYNIYEISNKIDSVCLGTKLSYLSNGLHYFSISQQALLKSMNMPPYETDNWWWLIDAPILIQQYYIADLLLSNAFPELSSRLKIPENKFNRHYQAMILLKMFIKLFIDRMINGMKTAPPDPELQKSLKQAYNRYIELREIALDKIQYIESTTGMGVNEFSNMTSTQAHISVLTDQLQLLSKNDPFFVNTFN